MRKRLVIIVYDISILGGAERVSVSIANELSELCDVTILSLHSSIINPAYKINGSVKVDFLGLKSDRLRSQMTEAFGPLCRYLKQNKTDVALIEGNYSGFVCSFVRPFVKTKLVFCDHGSFMSQYNDKDIRMIRRISTALCQHTVVLTERSRRDYIEHFHLKESKISCIYNWIEEQLYDPDAVYDEHSRTILSVGRFGKEKGYDLMVDVAEKVLPGHKDWKWVVYGNGETFDEIRLEVDRRDLAGQLILAGEKRDLTDAYSHAALLVLPSYREGLPLVLLEAKSHKLPLVSFDIITGPGEIIQNGTDGYLIPPYDTDAMAEKIEELMNDTELRKRLSEHTYDNMDQFRKRSILNKWCELIDRLGR